MEKMPYSPEECIALAAQLSRKYTGGDSTSVTYERAQSLMGAVFYCLDAYSRWPADGLAREGLTAKEAYEAGYAMVLDKMRQLVKRYEQLAADFEDYGLICLHDTVRAGLPEFLQRYDARFCPQDTLLTLDYPVFADLSGLSGVEAVWSYTVCIAREQAFLRHFDRQYVVWLLKQYDRHYEELIENVCAIVLANTLGHLLLAKPLDEGGLTIKERTQLEQILLDLPPKKMEGLLADTLARWLAQWGEADDQLFSYLRLSLADIAFRARQRAANGHLEHIFVW